MTHDETRASNDLSAEKDPMTELDQGENPCRGHHAYPGMEGENGVRDDRMRQDSLDGGGQEFKKARPLAQMEAQEGCQTRCRV